MDELREWSWLNQDDKLFVGYLSVAGNNWNDVKIYGDAALIAEGDTNGWQNFTSTVDLSGETINQLYLGFYFADGALGGTLDASSAFLDDVSVETDSFNGGLPIPEPGTILLLGFGLFGLAGYGIYRKKKHG